MKHTFLLAVVLSFFIFSCSKKKDDAVITPGNPCSGFEPPYAFNHGPVTVGQTLELLASSNEPDVTYEWTGPRNFTSTEQNPEINNITFDANGYYYVRVRDGSCTSNTQSTKVNIEPPCSIVENTGIFGTTNWNFYSSVNCSVGSSGRFAMHGSSSSNGDLDIQFYNSVAPTRNFVYGIEPGSNPVFDSSDVQLVLNTGTDVLRGQAGNVYVGVDDGKISASFCNVQFHSATTATTFYGQAKMVCQ